MGLYWNDEEAKKAYVREAAAKAQLVRKCLKNYYHSSGNEKIQAIEKALTCIKEIDALLLPEPEYYWDDFYWYHRTDDDWSLDIEVYASASDFYWSQKNYDLAIVYAQKAQKQASLSSQKNSEKLYKEFTKKINIIREDRRTSSPEYKAKQKAQKSRNIRNKICFYSSYVIFVLYALFAPAIGFGSKKTPEGLLTFFYLLIIAAVAAFYMLSYKETDISIYTVIAATPFAFMLYSLFVYIARFKEYRFFAFFFRQLILVVAAIVVGGLIGHFIEKNQSKKY